MGYPMENPMPIRHTMPYAMIFEGVPYGVCRGGEIRPMIYLVHRCYGIPRRISHLGVTIGAMAQSWKTPWHKYVVVFLTDDSMGYSMSLMTPCIRIYGTSLCVFHGVSQGMSHGTNAPRVVPHGIAHGVPIVYPTLLWVLFIRGVPWRVPYARHKGFHRASHGLP